MPQPEFTVEALAREADIKVSTIRLYQREELLPPPSIRSRIAYYDDGHLARLKLIARLQDRGFSLAAIRELVQTWEAGGNIGDLVGIEAQAAGTGHDSAVLSPAEFAALFPAGEVDAALALKAVGLGLVQFEPDGNVRLASRRLVEIGNAVAELGVGIGTILDEYDTALRACQEIADRFVALFAQRVWEPFAQRGYPAVEAGAVAAQIAKFRELGVELVTLAMRAAVDDAANRRFVEEATRRSTERSPHPR